MGAGIESVHWVDAQGNPAGGSTFGNGFAISWQNGPLGRGAERRKPNGAFVEDVIAAAIHRLEFYQAGKFACTANARALASLQDAAKVLAERTKDREARGVEGINKE